MGHQWKLKRRFKLSRLRPSAHETHEKGTDENMQASVDPTSTTENLPAIITEKVLGQELDQRLKREQPRRNRIHGADKQESNLRVLAIKRMGCKTDGLTQRSPVTNELSALLSRDQKETKPSLEL